MNKKWLITALVAGFLAVATPVVALNGGLGDHAMFNGIVAADDGVDDGGPVFLTGHDPDFHAQFDAGARNLLRAGLSFVTNGTYNLAGDGDSDSDDDGTKFLWVESRIPTPGGHRIGEDRLGDIGLTLGIHYDRANAAELAAVDFSDYTAIAIASSFGGLLTRAELDALIARAADIEDFINEGGGLFASSECFPCGANLLGPPVPAPNLWGYLPVAVSSIGVATPFTVTAFGAAPPFNLVNGDINSPSHNSFGLIGGLTPIDLDNAGNPGALAGIVGDDDDDDDDSDDD